MRICLLSYRSNPFCGGQGVYLKNLAIALKELGHDVEIVSGPPKSFTCDNIPVTRLKCMDLYDPENPFRIPTLKELSRPINILEWLCVSTMGFPEPMTFGEKAHRFIKKRRGRYDIVHDNQSLSYGIKAISEIVPTLATIHHPITVDKYIELKTASNFFKKVKILRWFSFLNMQKYIAKRLPHIITVSKSSEKDIIRDFKVEPNKITIIPNGIDTDNFYPIKDIKRQAGRIIVTTSSDTPLKGLAYLIKAVALVSAKRGDIKLVIVGNYAKNSLTAQLIKKLSIENIVQFTGKIDNLRFAQEYAKANVAVVPSLYEGFGLPAGEAMACKVPVIATKAGSLPEVVGDAGVLVAPKNSHALAEAIENILDNPKLASHLGEAGFTRIQENFTWKHAAQKTVKIYEKVIAEKKL